MFHALCDMAVAIYGGDIHVSVVSFENRVQVACAEGQISDTERDWLLDSIKCLGKEG